MRRLPALLLAGFALAGCGAPSGGGVSRIPVIPTTTAPPPRVAPASIDVPKIKAHSTLIPLGLNADGSLKVPDVKHPQQASYFCVVDPDPAKICSNGVVPGEPGPAVVVGHIDGAKQKGVFYDLPKMAVGDTATITEADGKVLTFSAYRVLNIAKTQFPASVVYGDTVGPELRLISCTGTFVGGQMGYANNIIIFMALVPNPPA
ncbi:MAG TPA: sortase [Pseudonocardiaceae bacterium]|jgi:hypothetical protein|nr:sortase [Pseudonocardiaceae bacterium]